jgi:hypothetical protein
MSTVTVSRVSLLPAKARWTGNVSPVEPSVAEVVVNQWIEQQRAEVPPTPQELLLEARALLDARHPRPAAVALRSAIETWLRTVCPGKKSTPVRVCAAVVQGLISKEQGRLFKSIWWRACRAAHGARLGATRVRIMFEQADQLISGKGGDA